MSAPLPKALRARFQQYIEEGLSGRAAALRLRLSPATGARWARAIRTCGHAAPAPQGRPKGRGKLAPYQTFFEERLSNLLSGNSAESGSGILAFPLDVGLRVGGPFFVDLDQHGADEAQERVFAGEDPDLDGAPFQLLLDGALHRV